MKQLIKITLVLLALSLVANASIRESELREVQKAIVSKNIPNCVDPKSFYDKVYCAGKVYAVLDDNLNQIYKNLRKKLNKDQKNRLKKVQRFWIKDRDDKCASVNSSGITLNLTCASTKTLESIIYLDQMNKNPKDFDILLKEYKELR